MTKVLIIDDEPALRFAVQEALEAHGLDVIAAETATAALGMLDDADVVVSDYMMPDMDGMQVLERAHASRSGRDGHQDDRYPGCCARTVSSTCMPSMSGIM